VAVSTLFRRSTVKLNEYESLYLGVGYEDKKTIRYSFSFYYHNFDPSIIWFDFSELHKLEEWVSNKLNIDFKLEKINSSKKYKLNFKLDDKFIETYNSIYDLY
jgi:hypothetical protein